MKESESSTTTKVSGNETKTEVVTPEPIKPDGVVETVKQKVIEVVSPVTVNDILKIVDESPCTTYKWKDRSVAPKGYMRGMAMVFARSTCYPSETTKGVLGDVSKDALVKYSQESNNLNTYTLLLGLGMRESSGKYCTGRDATAGNTESDTCEAGMFQTSYNANVFSPELKVIFEKYKKNDKCFQEYFSENVTCKTSDWKYYGTKEPGLMFQKLSKNCPAFAAEFASVVIRKALGHYGPLKRKEAEFNSQCKVMLGKVETLVKSNTYLCEQL